MLKIIKTFTQTVEFEYYLSPDINNSVIQRKPKEIPKFLPFYLKHIDRKDFPYPFVVLIEELDYGRKSICVSTKLSFIFWNFIYKVETLNHNAQVLAYFFLKNKLNKGVDFVPENQLVGGWASMFKHFLSHKLTTAGKGELNG